MSLRPIAVALWILMLSSPALHGRDTEVLLEDVDDLITKAMEEWSIPGLAVGVVTRNGNSWTRGFGVRDIASSQPVTPETLFDLGSCAQPFTSMLLSMLVDEGKVDMDQRIVDSIPNFRVADPLLTDQVTLRDLLSHRTGIPEVPLLIHGKRMTREEAVSQLHHIRPTQGLRVDFQSNATTFTVAEHIVERVTGMSWEDAIEQRIFLPRRMNASKFQHDELDDFARPHRLNADGALSSIHATEPTGSRGHIQSNVDDLLKWLEIYLGTKGARRDVSINPESLEQTYLPHMFVFWSLRDVLSPTTYGLAWGMNTYRGHYHARLGGFSEGLESLVSFFPTDGLGIVLLTNRGEEALTLLSALKFTIADRMLGLEPRDWIAWANPRLHRANERRQKHRMAAIQESGSPFKANQLGLFSHKGFGTLELVNQDGHPRLRYHRLELPLQSLSEAFFRVPDHAEPSDFRGASLRFEYDENRVLVAALLTFEADLTFRFERLSGAGSHERAGGSEG